MEVQIPTSDGRVLGMPRYAEPEAQQKMISEALKLTLTHQPQPRIRAGKAELPDAQPDRVLSCRPSGLKPSSRRQKPGSTRRSAKVRLSKPIQSLATPRDAEA